MDAIDLATLHPDEVQLVSTDEQTAGRGQRGTHWESERAQNLLFSFAFCPQGVKANQQFLLSQITALALTDALAPIVPKLSIKWPNDIYYQDQKLCGMLLYHHLAGQHIATTLVGIGLNVNQEHFLSDAPNPISLRQITGQFYEIEKLLHAFVAAFEHWRKADAALIARSYAARLYRKEGLHPYQDLLTGKAFEANLHSVALDGTLTLRDTHGQLRAFAFKELRFR